MLGQYLAPDVQEELLATYEYVPSAIFPNAANAKGRCSLSKLDAHVKALASEQSFLESEKNVATKKSKADGATASEGTKKRKKDGKGSHGVEKLKKANVNGMSKLSTFFTKKAE